MAITGTGTQTDPYRPETWEEVLQCTSTDSIYTVLPQNTVFDMNDYFPDGIPTGGIILRGFIDGNGSSIINAHYEGSARAIIMSQYESNGNIRNLKFLNFYLKATRTAATLIGVTSEVVDNARFYGQAFYNCIFSGLVAATSNVSYCAVTQVSDAGSISRCAYNITCIASGANLDTGNYTALNKNCNIRLDHIGVGSFAVDNCYMEGKISHCDINSISANAPSNSSVLNIESDSITASRSNPSMILVNTERYAETIPTGMNGVTDTQLKDADYLRSLGFPIIKVY